MLFPTTLPVEACAALHKPKAKWFKEEDNILMQAIEVHGPSNWNSLAFALPGRTGKQCRERWMSKLSSNFTTKPWTPEEDEMLIALQQERGNQWAKFKSFLPGRSTISIKNMWISIKRRAVRAGSIIPEPLHLRVVAAAGCHSRCHQREHVRDGFRRPLLRGLRLGFLAGFHA
jgi:hypothetical protein